jgi:hypothetical protein
LAAIAASRLPCPEPSHLRLPEEIVAGEHLVGSFSGEHHLDPAFPDESRKEEHRHRSGSEQRSLRVLDHLGKAFGDVAAAHHDLVVIGTEPSLDLALKLRLVVLHILEPERERAEAFRLHLQAERRDEGAIEAPRKVAAHRYVRAEHAQARRALEGSSNFDDGLLERPGKASLAVFSNCGPSSIDSAVRCSSVSSMSAVMSAS